MALVDWIKVEHTTPDKQEIHRMAEILGIDADAVFGKVIRFWIWADQNTESGNLNVTTVGYINRVTHCDGFGEAMLQVGWLQKVGEFLTIPNFDDHNTESAKKRAKNIKKVRKHRATCNRNVTEMKPEEGVFSVTRSSSPSIGSEVTTTDMRVFQDIPEKLKTKEFQEEWVVWEKYLREVHQKPMQPMMRGPAWQLIIENAQPGKEAIYGIASIRRAMAAGWKNLYTRKDDDNAKPQQRTRAIGGDAWGDAERWGSDIPELDPETGIVERPSERAARMAWAVG